MKLFVGLILLVLCTFLGYIQSGKYVDRRKYYNDFLSFINRLKQEVSFGQATIQEIIKNVDNNDFYSLLDNFFRYNNNRISYSYLNDNDKNLFLDFVEKIGQSDSKTQLNYLNEIELIISNEYTKACENEKIYKKLYVKISFLVGLMLLILVL